MGIPGKYDVKGREGGGIVDPDELKAFKITSALSLGEALGTGSEFWLDLKRDRGLWHSQQNHRPVPPLKKGCSSAYRHQLSVSIIKNDIYSKKWYYILGIPNLIIS